MKFESRHLNCLYQCTTRQQ